MKKFHTILWQENKLYISKALEIEVASQGKTEKEALTNLKEALELYFEGTMHSILNQANLTLNEFEKLGR